MLMLDVNALTLHLVQNLTLVKVSCSLSVQTGGKTVLFFFILAKF